MSAPRSGGSDDSTSSDPPAAVEAEIDRWTPNPAPVLASNAGRFRRFIHRRPGFVDGFIVAVYGGINLLGLAIVAAVLASEETFETPDGTIVGLPVPWSWLWFNAAHALIVSGALIFRRTRPWWSFGIIVASVSISASLGLGADIIALPLSLYALAVYQPRRRTQWALVGTGALVIASTFHAHGTFSVQINRESWVADLFAGILLVVFQAAPIVIAYFYGRTVRARRGYVVALVQRAEALAAERDQQAVIAAQAERTRIAREMHDVVAHSLTVMVALADGADAAMDRSPDAAHLALDRLTETGRSALSEMRRLLGVLGDENADAPLAATALAPQPTAEMLNDLVEQFRLAGLPVRLTRSGVLPEDTGLGLTVYRIVQEGLTNALRYSTAPTTVEVSVLRNGPDIVVEVHDDGTGAPRAQQGTGQGLVGMRERAALFGGTVTAEPAFPQGWRLIARLTWEEEDS